MKVIKTEARSAPNNEIWIDTIRGQTLVCERPKMKAKLLERQIMGQGFANESLMLYGKKLPFTWDKEGRWWVHPDLGSKGLMKRVLRNPVPFLQMVAGKTDKVKKIIEQLKKIDLSTNDKQKLEQNLIVLHDCIVQFYSYHFITYIVSDELVAKFRKVLLKTLSKELANTYFTEFLQAEITKEALKVGAIGQSTSTNRDIFYSDSEPIIFYREAKLMFESKLDKKIFAEFANSKDAANFFSLRLAAPVAVQISEEGQYIESKMLLPMFKITLLKIQDMLLKSGIIKEGIDIRDFSQDEIISMLHSVKIELPVLKGLGASPGTARGRAVIIKDMNDVGKFKEGDVLVTKITDPTMTIIMGKAVAIVCDIGSLVSHPSIISRELGIPCVVAAKNATTMLKDGDLVDVDGEKGIVRVISNVN